MKRILGAALALLYTMPGCGTKYTPLDLDGDGFTVADGDCWDAPEGPGDGSLGGADIFPGAVETWYDGIDQDCDRLSDNDQDLDGHDAALEGGPDCDDTDPAINRDMAEIWYDGVDQDCDDNDGDQDGDGYDAEIVGGPDCDDAQTGTFPGAEDAWYDGEDSDCAGNDDFDQDYDSYPVEVDCDDINPQVYPDPAIEEVWYNGADENCDGNDGDQDGDGYVPDSYAGEHNWTSFSAHVGSGDCWDDPDADVSYVYLNGFEPLDAEDFHPEVEERFYDGVDQDCTGGPEFDQDGDGFASAFYTDGADYGEDCIDGSELDDPNPAGLPAAEAWPGAPDAWYDGTDADCADDDDYDQDGDGYQAAGYGVGSDDDCDDTRSDVNVAGVETCDEDGADEDCDGDANEAGLDGCGVWYLDADADGYGDESGTSSCLCYAEAPWTASDATDCDDGDPESHPDGVEVCDPLDADQDCDGLADDADDDASGKSAVYADADGDGYGEPSVESLACDEAPGWSFEGTDCDDADAAVNPGAREVCDAEDADQDCDGLADDDDSGAYGRLSWYTDADDDGYGSGRAVAIACDGPEGASVLSGDCDDADADANPGAVEVCDDADTDEDCDDLTDDADPSASGQVSWYADADGDGYGVVSDIVAACERPTGYAEASGDCDESSTAINPGAVETCDEASTDEDCDGLVDDEDGAVEGTSTWYLDEDGDGYGGSSSISSCEAPGGYVATGGDCDDNEPDLYPGAAERCGDGLVNDCDGGEEAALAECRLSDALSADAWRAGNAAGDALGSRVSAAGDVEGDGYNDLVLAAPGASGGSEIGAVYLLSGPLTAGGAGALDESAARLYGGTGGDRTGAGLDGGLDLDGDGYPELLVGAPGDDDGASEAGAAYLFEGPLSGTLVLDASPEPYLAKVIGSSALDAAGTSVALLGDADGDGWGDLLVGAPGADPGATEGGAAWLVPGPVSSLSPGDLGLGVYGPTDDDAAGEAVARAGDLDGDGYADLLVGAPDSSPGGLSGAGRASAFLGPLSGLVPVDEADLSLYGEAAGDAVGAALAGALDVDGDGYDDLLVGAPTWSGSAGVTGAAALARGAADLSGDVPLSDASLVLAGAADGDRAGAAVSGAGDTDGDGYGDLLVGAPGADGSATDQGTAYLLYGPLSGAFELSAADAWLTGSAASDALGTSVSGAGDTDGDGFPDLLVGAPSAESGAGTVSLVLGAGI